MTPVQSLRPASRWLLLAAGAAVLLGGLAGCATGPGGLGDPTELHTAIDDSPARARARTRLALATSYFQNNLDQQAMAESHFQRAINLNPRDANAMHNLGWLQCQQGRYPEAAQSFQRAIAVPGYQGRARTMMAQGICESRAGDNVRAEATLKQSYELDPGNPVTAYNLSLLLYKRGDYQRAQFFIRRLNNSELANAESLWLGIRVERRLNDRQASDQLASQLRRRFSQSREYQAYERGAFDD